MPFEMINAAQKLFVFKEGSGYSCLGFDVVRDRTRQYAALLGELLPRPLPYANSEALKLYESLERRLAQSDVARTLTIYDPNTPRDLVGILESARLCRTRIRLFYGDRDTGRDWNEENDIEGYLGRTMGPIHCPMLLKTTASSGGGIILSACVVRVVTTAGKQVLWQHPKYHSLPFTISDIPSTDPATARWPIEVLRAGEVHARFKSRQEAERFVRKMSGK